MTELQQAMRTISNLSPAVPEKTRTGKWCYGGGTAPLNCRYIRKDGSPLTEKDVDIIRHCGPGFAKDVQTRTWPTKEEALAAWPREESR